MLEADLPLRRRTIDCFNTFEPECLRQFFWNDTTGDSGLKEEALDVGGGRHRGQRGSGADEASATRRKNGTRRVP